MDELRTVRISDLGRVVTGKTPPSSQPELFGDLHPFLTPTDIDGFARYIEPTRFLSPEGRDFQHRLMLPERAVCVVCIGATIGKVCMTGRPSFTNQQINSVVVNENEHDPFFVYHLLTTLRDKLKSNAGGAATPIINKTTFSEIEIQVPPLPMQRRIAGILSAYEELLENSQQRIRILESMTRALYREWFVYFRFPGHEKIPRVASFIGDIPQDWKVKTVADSFEISGGGTPSRKESEYWEGGTIQWFSPSDLTGAGTMFMDDSSDHITERGHAESSARLFPARSVMLTSRATIGAIAINTHEACTNQGFITCLPNDRVPLLFLFHWLTENVPTFQRMASGATFKEISRGVFKTIEFLQPPAELVRRFEDAAAPMAEQSLSLQRRIQNLRRTRDLLLPRLLSGQVELKTEEARA
jgi:type I restriction enzyme S subunit